MSSSEHSSSVPYHLGLILDGNRRWAREAGQPQLEGHRAGYKNLHKIAMAAYDRGVKVVSAYVFSTENWKRSQEEVDYLMDLLVWVATKELDKYLKDNIKMVFLGSRVGLSDKVAAAVENAETKSQGNDGGIVALCLNYGGHTEIAEGVARLMADGHTPDEVTPELVSSYIYHPEIPPVDLIIRTSGEQRLSNFMLWRAAYSELIFVEPHWPGFTVEDLDGALAEFASRQRRFGG